MRAYPLPPGYRGYERLPNTACDTLTAPALGLLVYLLRHRDRYGSLDDVAADSRSGLSRTAVRRYGAELRAAGHLRTVTERGPDGRLRSRVEVSALPIWPICPGRTEDGEGRRRSDQQRCDIAAGHTEDGGGVVGSTSSDAESAQVAPRTGGASSVRPGEMPVSAGRTEDGGGVVGPTCGDATSPQVSGSTDAPPIPIQTQKKTTPLPPPSRPPELPAPRGREEREEGEISSEEQEHQAAAEALAAGLPQSPASARPPSRQERQRLVAGIRRALTAGWTAATLRAALVADTATARRLMSVYLSRLDPEHEAYLGAPPGPELRIPEWCGQCDPHGAEDPHQRWIELPDGRVAHCPRCWPRPATAA